MRQRAIQSASQLALGGRAMSRRADAVGQRTPVDRAERDAGRRAVALPLFDVDEAQRRVREHDDDDRRRSRPRSAARRAHQQAAVAGQGATRGATRAIVKRSWRRTASRATAPPRSPPAARNPSSTGRSRSACRWARRSATAWSPETCARRRRRSPRLRRRLGGDLHHTMRREAIRTRADSLHAETSSSVNSASSTPIEAAAAARSPTPEGTSATSCAANGMCRSPTGTGPMLTMVCAYVHGRGSSSTASSPTPTSRSASSDDQPLERAVGEHAGEMQGRIGDDALCFVGDHRRHAAARAQCAR